MSELSELLAQKAALDKKIIEAQRAQKAQAIVQIKQLMSDYGLTLTDISSRGASPARKAAAGKVAAKYRHPQTGETWSGRGLQPNWLKSALSGGAHLDDFKL